MSPNAVSRIGTAAAIADPAHALGVVFALENLRDEPQPASSFELPDNLRKFSPEALIERIKQSDVWVEKPADAPPRP